MSITNQLLKELFERVKGNQKNFYNSVCDICEFDKNEINSNSLYWKAKIAMKKMQHLNKYKDKTRLKNFAKSIFLFPTLKKKKVNEVTPDQAGTSDQVIFLTKKVIALKDQLRRLKALRLNRQLKRKEETIKQLYSIIKNLKDKIKNMSKPPNITTYKDEAVQCNTMKKYINDLKDALDNEVMRNETDVNNNEVNEVNDGKVVDFRLKERGRPYNHQIRELYYAFRSRNVALEHIAPLLREVLSFLNIETEDLPSISTAAKMTTESGIISHYQLAEELKSESSTTMHRDATTKKGRHFYGVEIGTKEGTLTTGLREVHDGKAQTYSSITHQIMEDITSHTTQTNASDNILLNISNFMTDRSATEQKVNNLLSHDISNLHEEPSDINSFKCAVHPLLQFSEVCLREIQSIEKENDIKVEGFSSINESYTQHVIKCVSKLFFKDGTGDPVISATYFKNFGLSKLPILNFRGNRFNTLFYNAAGAYFLQQHLLQYLTTTKSSLNYIQSFITASLSNIYIMSILKALGLICKIITEPYWLQAGNEQMSAIEMGRVYIRLIKVLDECSNNPSLMLKGNIKLFPGPEVKDDVFDVLLHPATHDRFTENWIKKFCLALKLKCEHLFSDFLPNGKFHQPSTVCMELAESCPPNNITLERLMAKLDSKLHASPNTNTATIESTIIYKNNKTSNWLKSKSSPERKNVIEFARSRNKQYITEIKERKKKLCEDRMKTIEDREKAVRELKQKKEEQYQRAMDLISRNKLWEDEDQIWNEVGKLKTKREKINALKLKLIYIEQNTISKKKIYFSSATERTKYNIKEKDLLQFSHRGKQFDCEKLISNLKKLLQKRRSNNTLENHEHPERNNTIAENQEHTKSNDTTPKNSEHPQTNNNTNILEVTDSKVSFSQPTVSVSKEKVLTQKTTSRKKILPRRLSNLVGRNFFHVWDDDGKNTVWKGFVKSFKNGNFEVTYETEETVYALTKEKFITDFNAGDLYFEK